MFTFFFYYGFGSFKIINIPKLNHATDFNPFKLKSKWFN